MDGPFDQGTGTYKLKIVDPAKPCNRQDVKTMTAETEKIIEQQQLDNGIELFLYDRSRLTAGDRWQVELKCEAHIPIEKSFWGMMEHDAPQLLADVRRILGDRLVFVTTKKRNFVDAKERETVLQEMVQQIYSTMLEYLKKPHFPQKFFMKQYRDACQKVLLRQAMNN